MSDPSEAGEHSSAVGKKQRTSSTTRIIFDERRKRTHGRTCYVDEHELFPQATYYLDSSLQRPHYHGAYSTDIFPKNISKKPKSKQRKTKFSTSATETKAKMSSHFADDDEYDSDIDNQPFGYDDDDNKVENTDAPAKNGDGDDDDDGDDAPDFLDIFPSVKKHRRLGSASDDSGNPLLSTMPIQSESVVTAKESLVNIPSDALDDISEVGMDGGSDDDETSPQKTSAKFGTWDGVFVSCLLNIFGVIMFLRLGFVVGQAGVWYASLIILISCVVTTLTALSMAAIATNGEQRAGGAYYMISRALGPSFGAAVGVLFSIGMSVAVSMYVIGFCETVVDQIGVVTDSATNDIRIYGCILTTILLIWVLIGIGWVIKLQLVLMGILTIAILSFFIGSFMSDKNADNDIVGVDGWSDGTFVSNMKPHYFDDVDSVDYNFFTVFGIFFPACTGIMAGANISGDLRNPSYDIPVGTLWAIGVSTIVYLAMAFFCGAVATTEGLVYDYFIMLDVSIWSPLVLIGIYGATVSSALTSIVGGPRILLSVASDDLIPILRFFAKTSDSGEPVRAYFFTYFIAIGCVLIGNLNMVAPLITQFFLGTYAFISFACYGMSISHSPGWRPAFKYYSRGTALAGGVICMGLMCFIDLPFAVVALALGFIIFLYVYLTKPNVNWGSAFASRAQWKANENVLGLQRYQTHVKSFQPSFLVMSAFASPQSIDHPLIRFVQSLQRGFGTIVYGDVRIGAFEENISALAKRTAYLPENLKINAFHEIVAADNIRQGGRMLLQLSGLGKLRPNTLVLGFRENWRALLPGKKAQSSDDNKFGAVRRSRHVFSNDDYVGLLMDALCVNMGFMICRGLRSLPLSAAERGNRGGFDTFCMSEGAMLPSIDSIDVWWLLDDGGLSLLVPHIMSISKFWKNLRSKQANDKKTHSIRLFLVSDDDIGTAKDGKSNDDGTDGDETLLTDGGGDEDGTKPANTSVMELQELGRIARQGMVDLSRLENQGDLWDLEIQQLISKFRLNMKGPFTVRSGRSEPSTDTWRTFAKLMGYQWPIKNETIRNNNKLKRWLRVSELINEQSNKQTCVFITAPFPACFADSNTYLGVCHMLSKDSSRATILIRGTGQNCLTFYSE